MGQAVDGPPEPSGVPASPVDTIIDYGDAIGAHAGLLAGVLDQGRAKIDGFLQRLVDAGDLPTVAMLGKNGQRVQQSSSGDDWLAGQYRVVMQNLDALASKNPPSANVVGLDSLATYLNGLTPWSCLYSPEFANVYYRSAVGLLRTGFRQLSPGNVACPGGAAGPAATPPGASTARTADPTGPPTLSALGTGGNLATGSYEVVYTYVTPDGETLPTSAGTQAVTGPTGAIVVDAISLPSDVTAVKYYMSELPGSTTHRLVGAARMLRSHTAEALTIVDVPTSEYAIHGANGDVAVTKRGYALARPKVTATNTVTLNVDNGGVIPSVNAETPIVVQGYAPMLVELLVLTSFTGSGACNLQFTGLNQTGASHTWTVAVVTGGTGLAAGSVVDVPADTLNDRMRSVTAVAKTGGGSLTAGLAQLRVKAERLIR